jgi:hypothetical protein
MGLSLIDLRTFADWTLRTRLWGVLDVAKAPVFGNRYARRRGYSRHRVRENATQRIVLQAEGQSLTSPELNEVALTRRKN